jgi:RimJ/RimL family protein N-acetyltransferase
VDPPAQPLTDGVVVLRPADERDIDAIGRGIADPDVLRWIGPRTESAREVLERNRRRWIDGTGPTFAICDPDDVCIGHVWVNTEESAATVGYWLLPEARGRGLATRSVCLISTWAFDVLGLAQLGLVTDAENLASQRVAERSGFRRTTPNSVEPKAGRRPQIVYLLDRPSGG